MWIALFCIGYKLTDMKLDFVAIGDTVTDEFIFLKEASVLCDAEGKGCAMSMAWGEKIPFEKAVLLPAVGNAANAAVAAARLGLSSGLITNLGDDRGGAEAVAALAEEGVNTDAVVRHEGKPTNHHYVLSFESERTILIKHETYPYVFPKDLPAPRALYFSSIAEGTEEYHDAVATYLEEHPDIFFAFQPGTFQIRVGRDRLRRLYARTDIFFCNVQEAERILGVSGKTVAELAERIALLGPKIVCITDGPRGAYARQTDGTAVSLPMYPDIAPPVERTGAGDAFSSTTTAGLLMGLSLIDAMKLGAVNSAHVVQDIGAQRGLQTKEILGALAEAWVL